MRLIMGHKSLMEQRKKYHSLVSTQEDFCHSINNKRKESQCPQEVLVADRKVQWSSEQKEKSDNPDHSIGKQDLNKLIM